MGIVLGLLLWLLPVWAENPSQSPLKVWVSILPQKTFVERIGGAAVQVESLVQPGYDPHSYEPTPQQIVRLAQAQLYFRLGLPFESVWLSRIRAINPRLRIVELLPQLEAVSSQQQDPHIWLNPQNVQMMAQQIGNQLQQLKPQDQPLFTHNLHQFQAELTQLDQELQALFQPFHSRPFMVFHPAWGHFAAAYGLTQIAIEHEGKEPTAKTLDGLIARARREQIQTVFIQPQTNPKAAAQFAAAIQAEVVVLDDLAADYSANLRRVAQAIVRALQPATQP